MLYKRSVMPDEFHPPLSRRGSFRLTGTAASLGTLPYRQQTVWLAAHCDVDGDRCSQIRTTCQNLCRGKSSDLRGSASGAAAKWVFAPRGNNASVGCGYILLKIGCEPASIKPFRSGGETALFVGQ